MSAELGQPSVPDRVRLYARTARRAAHRYGIRPVGLIGPVDRRPIFVVGCPRSGTTFTATALGSVPGFADLGEVNRLKAGIPGLYRAVEAGHADTVVRKVRSILSISQRAAMVSRRRAIEQTPESTFLIPQLAAAFPQAHFIHLVRDGRDVVSSLIERGWLAGNRGELVTARTGGEAVDDAGHPFGGYARFWVERGREQEFESASEIRRCAWAWRRYLTTARSSLAVVGPDRVTTVRYEELTATPERVAARVAAELNAPGSSDEFVRALASAHGRSVGKHAEQLDGAGIAEVLAEAGPLLTELGYIDHAGAS